MYQVSIYQYIYHGKEKTGFPNPKYTGIANDIEHREKGHFSFGKSKGLGACPKGLPREDFTRTILCIVEHDDYNEARRLAGKQEEWLIWKEQTKNPNGFNIAKGGLGGHKYKKAQQKSVGLQCETPKLLGRIINLKDESQEISYYIEGQISSFHAQGFQGTSCSIETQEGIVECRGIGEMFNDLSVGDRVSALGRQYLGHVLDKNAVTTIEIRYGSGGIWKLEFIKKAFDTPVVDRFTDREFSSILELIQSQTIMNAKMQTILLCCLYFEAQNHNWKACPFAFKKDTMNVPNFSLESRKQFTKDYMGLCEILLYERPMQTIMDYFENRPPLIHY